MCDTEMLVMAVEKHPCLWDMGHDDYHNRDMKDVAWDQICIEVYPDWESLDIKIKKMKCADLKKKWTNTRDSYRKDLQKLKGLPSGSAAKKNKKYIFSDILSFLSPIFERRTSEGNYTPNEDTLGDADDQYFQQPNQSQNKSSDTSPSFNLEVKPKKKKDVPNQILELLHQRNQINNKKNEEAEEDDDSKFLLSFRSDMKKMNADEKTNFKIEMLKLVQNILKPSPPTFNYYSSPNPQTLYMNNPAPIPQQYSASSIYSQPLNIPNIQHPIAASGSFSLPKVVIKTVGAVPKYLPLRVQNTIQQPEQTQSQRSTKTGF